MSCSCRIERPYTAPAFEDARAIAYCPLHESAGVLLEALKEMKSYVLGLPGPIYDFQGAIERASEVIKKVEGQQ